jgi:predicted nucleic acid-binding protein
MDATLTLSWCFADESTTYSRLVLVALRQFDAVVPASWFFDVTRMLANAQRKGRIQTAGVEAFLQSLRWLPIRIDYTAADPEWAAQVPTEQRIVLTPYTLPYLHLARREGLSLATLDDSLRAAARVAGVKLVEVVV